MAVGFVVGLFVGAAATLFLRRRPHLDALTGIPTRRAADAALASLKRGDAVVMIDLDALKAVNDEHGHARGDAVLSEFASYLASRVRSADTVARWGGDEFVVVLRGGGAAAVDVVERLRAAAPTIFSAGIAVHDDGDGATTLASADNALLEAKRAGGSRVVAG